MTQITPQIARIVHKILFNAQTDEEELFKNAYKAFLAAIPKFADGMQEKDVLKKGYDAFLAVTYPQEKTKENVESVDLPLTITTKLINAFPNADLRNLLPEYGMEIDLAMLVSQLSEQDRMPPVKKAKTTDAPPTDEELKNALKDMQRAIIRSQISRTENMVIAILLKKDMAQEYPEILKHLQFRATTTKTMSFKLINMIKERNIDPESVLVVESLNNKHAFDAILAIKEQEANISKNVNKITHRPTAASPVRSPPIKPAHERNNNKNGQNLQGL